MEIISYIAQNLFWVFVGFCFGLFVYWSRLGQVKNELSSILHLFTVKLHRGEEFVIKAGVDVKSIDGTSIKATTADCEMVYGYERGVDWFFCSSKGLIRSRVIYASFKNDTSRIPTYYIISHNYIKS